MKLKDRPIARRFGDGLAGVAQAWRRERSFRTQISASVVALTIILSLQPPLAWQIGLAGMLAVGFAAELFNASIEALLDRVHPDEHVEIGAAKDMSSAAVLIINIASATIFAGGLLAALGGRG